MPNYTGHTRKQNVLNELRRRQGEWVAGLDLMNARVGGLRAGARIYELRKEGYQIERRTSKTSDVDEYRLVSSNPIFIAAAVTVLPPHIKAEVAKSQQEYDVTRFVEQMSLDSVVKR